MSVLDLGSGNSRFFEFLHTTLGEHFEYTGTDQCPQLLEIANKKYSKYSGFHTTNIDVIKNLDALDDVYDLVCAFGVTHHIPSSSLRDKWFRELGRLVNKNGFLVLSFWYTDKKSSEKYNGVLKTKLEQGDFILGWGIGKRYFRYVHIYSDGEISKIIQTLKTKGLELVDRFDEDFNSKSHNLYLIFKKNL